MKINLNLITILSILFFSCDNSTNNTDEELVNGKKILTSSTIYINQIIEGINRQRSVIIQTPPNINLSKDYPIVFALHGGGGKNIQWVNELKYFTDAGEFIGVYPQGYLNS